MKRNHFEDTYPHARRHRSRFASLGWLDVLSLVALGPFKLLAAVWRVGVRTRSPWSTASSTASWAFLVLA